MVECFHKSFRTKSFLYLNNKGLSFEDFKEELSKDIYKTPKAPISDYFLNQSSISNEDKISATNKMVAASKGLTADARDEL